MEMTFTFDRGGAVLPSWKLLTIPAQPFARPGRRSRFYLFVLMLAAMTVFELASMARACRVPADAHWDGGCRRDGAAGGQQRAAVDGGIETAFGRFRVKYARCNSV